MPGSVRQRSTQKFSSGAFTEGRLAGKSAVKYVHEHRDSRPAVDENNLEQLKEKVLKPLENYDVGKNMIVAGSVAPNYIYPHHGLTRLEKIINEYAGGVGALYTTNEHSLNKALKLLLMLKEDMPRIGAENLHQLRRAGELDHRLWTAEALVRQTLFRQETRWPGYYYRADFPKLDDQNWHVFSASRYDPADGQWSFSKLLVHHIIP
jgi:adenylylsulfate reductase, subunit A